MGGSRALGRRLPPGRSGSRFSVAPGREAGPNPRTAGVLRLLLLALLLVATPVRAQQAAAFRRAAAYSAAHAGDAVLVFQHDSLVLEDYVSPFTAATPHPLASGTKAFACVLAALAQADGLLALDAPLARALPELAGDTLLGPLTPRQLLSLTSGLEADPAAGGLRLATRPGRRFAYGGLGFVLFAEVLSRQLHGEDLLAWLTRRVLAPIGAEPSAWQRDGAGRPGLASGAAFTARAWAQYGLLLLHRGQWRGRQLVPRAALAECGAGSAANPSYGLGLWLNPAPPAAPPPAGVERAGPSDRVIDAPDLPHDLWLAAGTGGQRLYILPTQGLVVIRFGHNTGPDYRDDAFLRLLLGR